MYDWSATFTKGSPVVGPSDVDTMVADGAQTLFIQAATTGVRGPILEPATLQPFIVRARQRGLRVIAWYLPTFVDVNADVERLVAMAQLPVDGISVDIESLDVRDPNLRTQRFVALSQALRAALPGRTIGAIVPSPTLMDVVERGYWPGFPWKAVASLYDVWLPMAYWTLRSPVGDWHDPYRYTTDTVVRLRHDLGRADAPVDPIGGLASSIEPADADAFVEAVRATGSVGGSLYNYRIMSSQVWGNLRPLRS